MFTTGHHEIQNYEEKTFVHTHFKSILYFQTRQPMKFENLELVKEDGILIIRISRPDFLNALNSETLVEIETAVLELYEDSTLYGAIVTGVGDKAFVAGSDITEFANHNDNEGKLLAESGQRVLRLIEYCPKPVIAAVNGYALGGGCELAMACHIRLASENAKFGQPEVNLGLIPGFGGTQRLIQLVGKGKAMELLMTAEMVSAKEALEIGLVNHVFPAVRLMFKSVELMKKIISKSPIAIAGVIRAVNAHSNKEVDGFEKEAELFGECFASDDKKEGVDAFLDKRTADFRR